jgi:plastocyanin
MSRNFSVTGATSLLAIAACGETTGENVTFAFGSSGHNIAFDTPYAPTPAGIPGANVQVSVQRTFSSPGTHRYHCTIHQRMNGAVVQ